MSTISTTGTVNITSTVIFSKIEFVPGTNRLFNLGVKYQPNRDYVSDDVVQTPVDLAKRIVDHFSPSGRILEPCCGEGNFLQHMPGAFWCEIKEGKDFFEWDQPVDWIMTNPPWSKIRPFLQHSMMFASDIVFLMTVNHVWTKARIRDIYSQGFAIKEICLVEMPPEFPQSGFQLGAIHVSKGWKGEIKFSDISVKRATIRKVAVKPGAKRALEHA